MRWHEDDQSVFVEVYPDMYIAEFLKIALREMKIDYSTDQIKIIGHESVAHYAKISTITTDNSGSNPVVLYIAVQEYTSPKFKNASIGNTAPSKYALDGNIQSKVEISCRVYEHWFALEAYDLFVKAHPGDETHVFLQFCEESNLV